MCQYKINIKQGQKDIDATTWMHVRDGITLTAWVDEWIMSCFPNRTPLYKCEGYSSVEKTKEKKIFSWPFSTNLNPVVTVSMWTSSTDKWEIKSSTWIWNTENHCSSRCFCWEVKGFHESKMMWIKSHGHQHQFWAQLRIHGISCFSTALYLFEKYHQITNWGNISTVIYLYFYS